MEKLCNNIASKVAGELNLSNDQREVIAYGAFAILQMLYSILIVVLFGLLFHVVIEALIISFTISILRKYSGGIHASSPGRCLVIGTVVCTGQAVLISYVIGEWASLGIVLFLGLLFFTWSYYIVYKLAPVESPAKPIKREEKRKKMKKGSIIILSAYLFIILINCILYLFTREKVFMVYSLCIYGGIIWQVFTLTNGGHLILGKVDTFLKSFKI